MTQFVDVRHWHVCRVKQPMSGRLSAARRSGDSAVDRLADYGRHRDSALPGYRRDAAVTLVVEQNLKTVLQWHAHTLA